MSIIEIKVELEEINEAMQELREQAQHYGHGAAKLDRVERRKQKLENMLEELKNS